MNKKKNNSLKQLLVYGLILLLSVLLIYWFVSGNNDDKQISYTEFQQMVQDGQVAEIDVYGYTVRIRKVGGVSEKNFPKKLDAYCSFMSYNELVAFIDGYNNVILEAKVEGHENFNKYWEKDAENNIVLKEGVVIVQATYSFESESWISSVMPYLSIIIVVVLGIFLFKLF